MATYLEVKQILGYLLTIREDISETSDIQVRMRSNGQEGVLTLSNDALREVFDRADRYRREKLELYTERTREVAVQISGWYPREHTQNFSVNDDVNHLSYTIGIATKEYAMLLLNYMADYARENGQRALVDVRINIRHIVDRVGDDVKDDPLMLLPVILRAYTVKVISESPTKIEKLRAYAASFAFMYMYKCNIALTEYADIQDMYVRDRTRRRQRLEDMDMPPLRIYNAEVLDYYALAMESEDPFGRYISFYHVIEHYFDAVFRKKLTEAMRERITTPGFSYKSEEKLYELAKYVKKHMSSDDDSGKGNELESLRYVLMEYVPVDELKARLSVLDTTAVAYYQTNKVPFVTGKETKIPWTDTQGVYTKLAQRIYETRNALVHSKSEQGANQYKPYNNRKDLLRELALIQAVAELVLIKSSEVI